MFLFIDKLLFYLKVKKVYRLSINIAILIATNNNKHSRKNEVNDLLLINKNPKKSFLTDF